MKRILLAALAGGLVLFAWESFAHIILPLGEAGVRAIANEQPVLTALRDNIRQPGLYLFPAPDIRDGMSPEQRAAAIARAQERWRTGPAGVLVFHPAGTEALSPRQLVVQWVGDILAMLLAAVVLSQTRALGYLPRVLLVAGLGLLPALQSEVPDWNWYGFPAAYTLAQLTVHLVGFLAGGLVLAGMLPPREETP